MKKINGYLKWATVIITLLGIFAGTIWNAATIHNDVAHLTTKVSNIETLLIEHISKQH